MVSFPPRFTLDGVSHVLVLVFASMRRHLPAAWVIERAVHHVAFSKFKFVIASYTV